MNELATVIAIRGSAFVVGLDGRTRPLKVGDKILKGETVVTGADAQVELAMEGAQPLSLGPTQTVKIDESLSPTQRPAQAEASVGQGTVDSVIQALEQGGDLNQQLEATAAGAGGGGGEGGGSSFVRLLRISEGIDPLAYEFSTARTGVEPVPEGEAVPVLAAVDAPPSVVGNVTLRFIALDEKGQPLRGEDEGYVFIDGDSVVEGQQVGLIAMVDLPPSGTPLNLTVSITTPGGQNSYVVTIPVGGDSGWVVVDTRPDELFQQGEQPVNAVLTGATGGGYDELNVSQPTPLTVRDDTDPVYAEISVTPSTTGEGGAFSYTVKLVDASGNAITVPVGTTVTVNLTWTGVAGALDVVSLPPSVTIAGGSSQTTFGVTTQLDGIAETSESLVVSIGTVTSSGGQAWESISASTDQTKNSASTTITDVVPTIGDDSARVSEEDLDGGIKDTVGVPNDDADDSNDNSFSGTLAITRNGSAPLTADFSLTGLPTSLGGTAITWAYGDSQAVLVGSDAEGQPVIRIALNGGSTAVPADGSTIGYEVELLQPISHPDTSGEDALSFSVPVRISDGVNTADTGAITITIEDDSPSAVDDSTTVELGGASDEGLNLLDNDAAGGDGGEHLVSFTVNGETYTFSEDEDSFTVDTGKGMLTVNQDGSYSYTSDVAPTRDVVTVGNVQPGSGAYGFVSGDGSWLSNGQLVLTELDAAAQAQAVKKIANNEDKAGIGVGAQGNASLGSGEALVLDLGAMTTFAGIGIGQFNANQAEFAQWSVYDASGNLVASGDFDSGISNGNIFSLNIVSADAFRYIVFEYTQGNDGYVVSEVTVREPSEPYTEDITYVMADADGDTDTGALTINVVQPVVDGAILLEGTSGSDALVGSDDNDVLRGLGGADVFQWNFGDEGTSGSPHVDRVDFNVVDKDSLDLRDLLSGEHSANGSFNLTQYLSFGTEGGKLALLVDADGSGTNGAHTTQTIVFEAYDNKAALATALSLDANASDTDILKKMVADGYLKTET